MGGIGFSQKGWVRLSYQFSVDELKSFSDLSSHIGRGQRLADMAGLASRLPKAFKSELSQMGYNPAPLRAVGFNKSADENWSLPWHQDRIIAMPRKDLDPRFKNWSRKSGIWHCEPPPDMLAQIAFAYIACDDIPAEAGGLEIAEATHMGGAIAEGNITEAVQAAKIARPSMQLGEVLLISALTLHRSAPMKTLGNRRALRIDFGSPALNLSRKRTGAP